MSEEDDVDVVQDVLETIKNRERKSKISTVSKEVTIENLPIIVEPDRQYGALIKPKELSEFSRKLIVAQTLKPRNDQKHQDVGKSDVSLADRIEAAKRDGISLSSTSSKSRSGSSISSVTTKINQENKQKNEKEDKRSVGTQTVYNDVGVMILLSSCNIKNDDDKASEAHSKNQSYDWKSLVNDLKNNVNYENSECQKFFKDLRTIRRSLNQPFEETKENYLNTDTKATNTEEISEELASETKSLNNEKQNSDSFKVLKHLSDDLDTYPLNAIQNGSSNSSPKSHGEKTSHERRDDTTVNVRNHSLAGNKASSRSKLVMYSSKADCMQYKSTSSFSDKNVRRILPTKHKKIAKSKIDCWWPEGNKYHCVPNVNPALRTHESGRSPKTQFISFRFLSSNIREMTTQQIYRQDLVQMLKRKTSSSASSSSSDFVSSR